ncbi:uncharacterized protein LOC113295103 [Papaver somniferum]|uniref:uncharacterized protein LOC113295103 n=1 Tax=Papaver somniferum TaxID=3469 RepID=UPI000E6F7989|nr:uncharacterized protein LOC113295103 [Papaver somniferum]
MSTRKSVGEVSDLIEKMRNTNLDGDEQVHRVISYPHIKLKPTIQKWIVSLIAKKFCEHPMSPDTVEQEVVMAWGHNHFQLRRHAKNMFIYRFFDWDSYNYVMEEGPWSFDGYLVVFREWSTSVILKKLDFHLQQFWIDIKKLLPEFLNVEVGNQIASILGNPLKLVPEDGNPTNTNAVSVLIEFSISNPILRGLLTENTVKITQWVPIYFQRQPRKLCPACLILDHNELECANKAKDVQDFGNYIFKFGEDFGEVIDPRDFNPKYKQAEKILISPKKSRGKNMMEKKPFQIPEDGYHVSTIYSQSSGDVAEISTARRPKRARESPGSSSQASQQHLEWFLSCIYGSTHNEERKHQWEYLQDLGKNMHMHMPWITYQQSREQLLRCENRNNIYFYNKANYRRRRNHIDTLQDKDGNWISNKEDIEKLLVQNFKEIYTSCNPALDTYIFNLIQPCVTDEENQMLITFPAPKEVKDAMFQINAWAAPGPDGYQAGFYQQCWDIVGRDIVHLVQQFFASGQFPSHINQTFQVLIPKQEIATKPGDYRPISLCRNIYDNEIIAQEMVHYMKNTKAKMGVVGVKLDMDKAFDRMEWFFLHQMLLHLGFPLKWCQLINHCVRTASISLLMNGVPMEPIFPTRVLRKGNAISPYLFILFMEGFSRLIISATTEKLIDPIKPAVASPQISHLFFADDCLLFIKGNRKSVSNLMHIIKKFTSASCQMVNLGNSSVFFNKHMGRESCEEITRMLNMKELDLNEKYLGTNLIIPRSRDKCFDISIQKMQHRLPGWQGKLINQVGRTVQVQSTLSSTVQYQMGIFMLPDKTHKKINQIQRKYLWNHKKNKGFNPKSWSSIWNSKKSGGLGFKDSKKFNIALLTKLAWRLLTPPQDEWVKVLRAIYVKNKDLLSEDTSKKNSSWVWQSIKYCLEVVRQYYIWEIGDGKYVKAFKHNWMPNSSQDKVQYYSPEQIQEIVSIRILAEGKDKLRWSLTSCGVFTTKSVYNELTKHNNGGSILHQMEGKGCSVEAQHKDLASLAACTLWHIWKASCEKVFENRMHHPSSIIYRIRLYINSFSYSGKKYHLSHNQGFVSWKKPPENWLKLNIDASVKNKNSNAEFALIFRDYTGKFVGTMAYSAVSRDINQVEALVLLKALNWIKNLGFKQVIIEGDNEAVVNCCNRDISSFKWEDQQILLECKSLLSKLESCVVSFQRRLCNQAADKLAKFARTSIHCQTWWNEPPNILNQVLV